MPRHRAAWRTGFAELEVFVDGRDFPAMADCSRSTALIDGKLSILAIFLLVPSKCYIECWSETAINNNCIQLDSHLYVVLLQHV